MLMRKSWSVSMHGSEMDSSDETSSNLSNTQISYTNLTEKWVYRPPREKPTYSSYSSDDEERENQDGESKRLTYCYLCSIGAHVHKKTEPVPIHKRRYLKPYLNPFELERRLERQYRQIVPKIRYRFLIQTGAERNGGTDAPVFFKLYGTAGVWEATQLRVNTSANRAENTTRFATGSKMEIMLDGPVIGELQKLKIWHNGKSLKDDWYLDFVEITCYKLNQTWRFICDQWISKKANSNPLTLTLGKNVFDSDKAKHLTEYVIMIKTSSKPLVGRDINVQFQFVCAKGQTQVFNLLTQHVTLFEPFQLDCFLVRSSHDLGKPEKLRMAHNAKRTHEWSIESIRVYYSKDPSHYYAFKVDKWLEKNDKMNAIISMQPLVPIVATTGGDKLGETGKMIYHISTMTGQVKFAGTDAKVFIQFKGSAGLSEVHRLHNPRTKQKQEFERGQIDHFHIFDKNLGDLKMIKIWHDNTGSAPGWFLQAVLIKAIPTTLSGREDKHDIELRDQIDKLIKKYRIKDLNLEDSLRSSRSRTTSSKKTKSNSSTRSKSADTTPVATTPSHSNSPSPTPDKNSTQRSTSVESNHKNSKSVSLKNVLKRNHAKSHLSRSSPTLSILKTSASPRNTRKSVKFDAETTATVLSSAKQTASSGGKDTTTASSTGKGDQKVAPRVEMNLEWIMSIAYAENGPMRSIRTIENFDTSIKAIDNSLVDVYNNKMKKLDKVKASESSDDRRDSKSPDQSKIKSENAIYVFECNKWLAKDSDDRKIERIIKLSNVLASK